MPNEDLCYLPAIELAAAIRTRRLSPVELTAAILDRIAQVNPKLNAYCTVVPEAALAAAQQAEAAVMQGKPLGPLHGIRLSFKISRSPPASAPCLARRSSSIMCRKRTP